MESLMGAVYLEHVRPRSLLRFFSFHFSITSRSLTTSSVGPPPPFRAQGIQVSEEMFELLVLPHLNFVGKLRDQIGARNGESLSESESENESESETVSESESGSGMETSGGEKEGVKV